MKCAAEQIQIIEIHLRLHQATVTFVDRVADVITSLQAVENNMLTEAFVIEFTKLNGRVNPKVFLLHCL